MFEQSHRSPVCANKCYEPGEFMPKYAFRLIAAGDHAAHTER